MRTLEELTTRWRETQSHSANLAELRRAVRYNGPSSPCVSGCRSVCWKTFLWFKDGAATNWQQLLSEARKDYSKRQEVFLKFIKHPEDLAKLAVDPLADDPDSPWDALRQDEVMRIEIQQDVQRLPEEGNYHDERIQTMILDILFVYCKTNPDRGGYRQGMHELLAPIVHVVEQDAVDRSAIGNDPSLDDSMLEMIDAAYIEHDSYALFSHVMEHAQVFYEVKDSAVQSPSIPPSTRISDQSSAIVARSKFIHEVCLQKVDPELASHLTTVEILPQIFLIRWVRLLFSREFPFDQFLVLWDTIFAVDPSLELIDLICVAMLIRIRWQLIEADYSVCLQLLLKYPPPELPHGPHTFVDDAVYLRSHLNASGGASLVMKYTGKMTATAKSPDGSGRSTPNFQSFGSPRLRGLGGRSPSSFIQPTGGGMEALFQGAAKGARGVLERGEKLGINQAVREAMGEIRKNMQGFNESRYSPRSPREVLSEDGAAKALAAMERRNRQLASMLEETVADLKSLSSTNLDDKTKSLQLIEVAAAKVQFVQIYLEDSSMNLPASEPPPEDENQKEDTAQEKQDKGDENPTKTQDATTKLSPPTIDITSLSIADQETAGQKDEVIPSPNPDKMDTSPAYKAAAASVENVTPKRPAPAPTRSSIAQSSFSWMLEPDETKATRAAASSWNKSPSEQPKKRSSNSASRDKNAFLFGELASETARRDSASTDEIFGLEPLQREKRT